VTARAAGRPRNALTNLYRTKDDRWLQLLIVRDDRLWPDLLQRRSAGRAARRSALHRPRGAQARRSSCMPMIAPVFAAQTYAEWEAILSTTGIPSA
jgi:formyl-CoA transferase